MTIRHTVKWSSPLHGEAVTKLLIFILVSLLTAGRNGLSIVDHDHFFLTLSCQIARVQTLNNIQNLEAIVLDVARQVAGQKTSAAYAAECGTQVAVDSPNAIHSNTDKENDAHKKRCTEDTWSYVTGVLPVWPL